MTEDGFVADAEVESSDKVTADIVEEEKEVEEDEKITASESQPESTLIFLMRQREGKGFPSLSVQCFL